MTTPNPMDMLKQVQQMQADMQAAQDALVETMTIAACVDGMLEPGEAEALALAVRARGEIQFWNKVYEGGFTWLPELAKFGAHLVVCDPHRVIVFGDKPLRPAVVEAPYIIRAAVALYMVAASIPGRSGVRNAGIIQRAHPRFVENLRALGAEVEWTG